MHTHGFYSFTQPCLPPNLALVYASRCYYLIQPGLLQDLVLVLTSNRDT